MKTNKPTVSFIVPCYKLAHLLAECVNSILAQSYTDFEVLIMDDCSPDDTGRVAKSFVDPRVKYIRNDPNLGHLRNYNKGIQMSEGKFVWLISADDYLKSSEVLKKYVDLLEQHPKVGFVFCPGFGVGTSFETRVMGAYSVRKDSDRIFDGHFFLRRLLQSNFVLAASGMARRECYEKISYFPLDMPYAGDWYIWAIFALHYDVGYIAEPMVCYRKHELSMTNNLFQKGADICCEEDVSVPWRIKEKAVEAGFKKVATLCLDAVSVVYARNIASMRYGMTRPSLTFEQFEEALCRHTVSEPERARVRARVLAGIGNEYYWQGKLDLAKEFYRTSLLKDPWMPTIHLKRMLLSLGKRGDILRKNILSARS